MLKKTAIIILLLTLLFALSPRLVYASSDMDQMLEEQLADISDVLPNSVSDYLDDKSILDSGNILYGFLAVVRDFTGNLGGYLQNPLQLFGILCAIMICCAIGQHLLPDNKPVETVVNIAGALAVSVALTGVINNSVADAFRIVELSESFTSGFIPVFSGIIISTGHVSGAALYGAGIVAAATAVSSIITVFIKPMTGVLLGLAVVSGLQDQGIRSVITGIKRVLIWIMGILTSLFIGLVGLQSLVSAQSDNLALRTTKYLVGSSIPIIGSSVSEAAGTVTNSLRVIKATVGSVGILSLLALFLPVIAQLLLVSLSMSLAAVSGEALGADTIAGVIRSVKSVIEIMVALVVFYFIALVICTAIMIQVGSAV